MNTFCILAGSVLSLDGWAILQVPILGNRTIEDPTIIDPKERERVFGQFDHVRLYGNDGVYKARLEWAGFKVNADPFAKNLGPEDVVRYGLVQHHDVYYCTKR